MNHDMIRDKIIGDSKDNFDALYRLLYARGFLVEKDEKGCIYMSDNAYDGSKARWSPHESSDWRDLIQVMNGMIHVDGDRIVSCTPQFSIEQTYDVLFHGRISYETCSRDRARLKHFKSAFFPEKLRTLELEPFVAMYVKAVSAIRLETELSCQGHTDMRHWQWLFICFCSRYYTAFHHALWATDTELRVFNLKWCHNMSRIKLTGETVDDIYVNVIRAGQYLYENRDRFRKMRKDVAAQLSKKDEELSDQELKRKMIALISNYTPNERTNLYMTGYKKDFVADFAERTFKNLCKICRQPDVVKGKGYEVTQLINSFVGLLVFPQQEQDKNHWECKEQRRNFTSNDYWNLDFPNKKIETAYQDAVKENAEYLDKGSLFQKMIKHLRNAVSHQNLQVEPMESDEDKIETSQVIGFNFTDNDGRNSITFFLTVDDIYNILMSTLYRIIDGIEDRKYRESKKKEFLQKAKEIAGRFNECTLSIEGVMSEADRQRFAI